uniref:Uncharacterized protein n=1 Tax=Tetranychus urticae TaxID=32264 RepID=T1L1A6_TETUR
MRFTIVLALCFIGDITQSLVSNIISNPFHLFLTAASASSLNKRSFIDDIQNNTQNAFHAFEQFGQTFNEKVQEALKNLLSAFGNKNSSAEASVSVSKRATNPLQLINDLDDPAQFAQTFLKVLLDLATGQGRRKRDIAEDLKKFSEEAKHNAEEALKKLFSFLEQFKPQSSESTEASVVVEKRATNPLQLINDLDDPAQFAQTLLKVLADIATGQGRRKRDIAEDLKKFSDEAKHNAEEALKKLFSFLEQFKPQSSESTEAPVVVEKRATNPLVLFNDLSQQDLGKFAQDFLKVLADIALAQG